MLGQMSRVPISDELVHLAAGLVWTIALSFNGLLAWAARNILPLSYKASGDSLLSSESGSSEPHGKAVCGEIFTRRAQGSDGPTTFLPGLKGLLHPFIQTNVIETNPSSVTLVEDISTRLKACHQSCQGLRPVSMILICATSSQNGESPDFVLRAEGGSVVADSASNPSCAPAEALGDKLNAVAVRRSINASVSITSTVSRPELVKMEPCNEPMASGSSDAVTSGAGVHVACSCNNNGDSNSTYKSDGKAEGLVSCSTETFELVSNQIFCEAVGMADDDAGNYNPEHQIYHRHLHPHHQMQLPQESGLASPFTLSLEALSLPSTSPLSSCAPSTPAPAAGEGLTASSSDGIVGSGGSSSAAASSSLRPRGSLSSSDPGVALTSAALVLVAAASVQRCSLGGAVAAMTPNPVLGFDMCRVRCNASYVSELAEDKDDDSDEEQEMEEYESSHLGACGDMALDRGLITMSRSGGSCRSRAQSLCEGLYALQKMRLPVPPHPTVRTVSDPGPCDVHTAALKPAVDTATAAVRPPAATSEKEDCIAEVDKEVVVGAAGGDYDGSYSSTCGYGRAVGAAVAGQQRSAGCSGHSSNDPCIVRCGSDDSDATLANCTLAETTVISSCSDCCSDCSSSGPSGSGTAAVVELRCGYSSPDCGALEGPLPAAAGKPAIANHSLLHPTPPAHTSPVSTTTTPAAAAIPPAACSSTSSFSLVVATDHPPPSAAAALPSVDSQRGCLRDSAQLPTARDETAISSASLPPCPLSLSPRTTWQSSAATPISPQPRRCLPLSRQFSSIPCPPGLCSPLPARAHPATPAGGNDGWDSRITSTRSPTVYEAGCQLQEQRDLTSCDTPRALPRDCQVLLTDHSGTSFSRLQLPLTPCPQPPPSKRRYTTDCEVSAASSPRCRASTTLLRRGGCGNNPRDQSSFGRQSIPSSLSHSRQSLPYPHSHCSQLKPRPAVLAAAASASLELQRRRQARQQLALQASASYGGLDCPSYLRPTLSSSAKSLTLTAVGTQHLLQMPSTFPEAMRLMNP